MLSTMVMILSITCFKLRSSSFWIAKRYTLTRADNAYLTWTGSILFFLKGTAMQIEKELINVCLRVSKVS